MATAYPRPITVEEFLAIEWDSSDVKAELDNGVIRMMAGGTGAHARVQGNIMFALLDRLRGTGCRPFGSDMGVRTTDVSLRYPDVAVFCGRDGPENDRLQAFDDPRVIVEVLSPTTRAKDLGPKLREYREMSSLGAIVYVDPDRETIRLLTRASTGSWRDASLKAGEGVLLETVGVTLTWAEVFARS